MAFYLSVPLSKDGVADMQGKIEKVDGRAHASELIYGDAAYILGLAQRAWPDLDWNLQHVRTRTYVVKGEPKG